MRPWAACAFALVLACCMASGAAHAQALLPADADGDGVADDADACPDSPAYELVDGDGCSVCDCDDDASGEPWASRTAYLRCVFTEVHARRVAKTLGRREARPIVKAARSSTCGSDHLVRCCIMFEPMDKGVCRVMDELRCDEGTLHAATVEDLDSGSCFPNPCETP